MPNDTKTSKIMSFLSGATQGASFDFGDEGYALGLAAKDYLQNPDMTLDDVKANYKTYRDQAREYFKAQQEASPVAYGAGEIAGGFAGPSPFSKTKALGSALKAAMGGALGSLGASEAEDTSGMLADVGRGAAIGGVMSKMGDVIKFPGKKKLPTKDIAKDIKAPDNVTPIREDVEKVVRENSHPQIVRGVLESAPKSEIKAYEKAEKLGSNEPYIGKTIQGDALSKIKPIGNANQIGIQNYIPDGKIGRDVPIGGADPFAWMDTKYGFGRKALEAHAGKPLDIKTRSDLIAHDDYLSLLDPKKHEVTFYAPNANENVSRALQVGAPSLKRIIAAAQKLRDNGIKTNIVFQDLPIKDNLKLGFGESRFFIDKEKYKNFVDLKKQLQGIGIKTETRDLNEPTLRLLRRNLGEDSIVPPKK